MKKICFVASHLMSGSSILCDALDENPRVQHFRLALSRPYWDVSAVFDLIYRQHKLDNSAAVYLDELIFNYELQIKHLYSCAKFVYVVRPPIKTLNLLVSNKLYTPLRAVRYYCYRLRRLCEMAKRTPGAVLLQWDDLITGRGLSLVEDYLSLKVKLEMPDDAFQSLKGTDDILIPNAMMKEAEICYERHLSFLFHQTLYTV